MSTITPLPATSDGRLPLKMLYQVIHQQRLDNDEKAPAVCDRGVEKMLSVPQVCQRLRVGHEKVHAWIRTGELRAINVGSGGRPRWRIDPLELELFLRDRTLMAQRMGLRRLPR